MKNATFLLWALLLAARTAHAQSYTFTRPYGTIQTDINRGQKIIATQDGNYLIAGEWNGLGYLMKVNCKGDSLDRKTYLAEVGGNYKLTDVLELNNGDILVGGQCDHCVPGDTTGKVVVFQTDAGLNFKPATGVKKFLPPVTGPLMTTGQALPDTRLAAAADGFYILSLTGCLTGPGTFGCWNAEDSYVTKLDPSFNIQWHKLLDYKNQFIFHYENNPQIVSTPANLFVARWGNNLFATLPDSSAVQKTDLSGNALVSRTFRGRILGLALNPAGTVLTCAGDVGEVAWLTHLDANTLNVLKDTFLDTPQGLTVFDVKYSSDGHLLAATQHVEPSAVRSRVYRMDSGFHILGIDSIPNPDNFTNMGITSVWPANGDGSHLVSCGIRGFYNRTFFHARNDCLPFNLTVANLKHVTCNGAFNGSATLSAGNGFGPFQYSKGNGIWQNSGTFNSLSAGDYMLSARDGNGNVLSIPLTITQPPLLTVSAVVNQTSIIVTQNGGVPPMQYSLDGQNFQTGNVFTGLNSGNYTVTVKDANGCTASQSVVVTSAPTAAFSANLTSGCAPLAVQFVNNSSANATSFQWAFPGGTPAGSAEQNPLVTYSTPGTYPVTLTAINAAGSNTASKTGFITVFPGPEAGFDYSSDGAAFTFLNTSEFATFYLWNFGDGNGSTETDPTHTFSGSVCDAREITLVAINSCGADTATLVIPSVDPVQPDAAFTFTANDLTVTFTNAAANAETCQWDFGDGNTSSEKNPVHTYANPGTYPVKLTVTEVCGFISDTAVQTVVLTTAASEPSWLDGFRLYPQPNRGVFTLEIQGRPQAVLSFALFDATGRRIDSQALDFGSGSLSQQFVFERLPAGLYTLQVSARGESKYVKMVVD